MIISHKYGKIKINPKTYHEGMTIASYHAVNPYEFTLNKIKDIVPDFLLDKEVVSTEVPKNDKWLFKDKYGVFRMHIVDVMNNSTPASYLNRTDAFINKIDEKWPNFFKKYTLLGEIYRTSSDAYFIDDVGAYKSNVNKILTLGEIGARSCLNKTNRYLNLFKKRKDYDNYDFSLYKYTNKNTKSKFICKEHGTFEMLTHCFLKDRSCPRCNPNYYSKEIANKNKKLFINRKAVVYVIKMYNKEENFYKVGITVNTTKRFNEIQKSYNYKVIKLIPTNLYDAIYIEDKVLKSEDEKYTPKIKFGGHTECFKYQPNLI